MNEFKEQLEKSLQTGFIDRDLNQKHRSNLTLF